MYVIQPLAGRMKHDCMIVNSTVKYVYDRLLQGSSLDDLADGFAERALAEMASARAAEGNGGGVDHRDRNANDLADDRERARFDLYRTLISLKDREICDYPMAEILRLLPAGKPLRGTTQVLQMCMLEETASFLRRAVDCTTALSVSSDVGSATVAGNGAPKAARNGSRPAVTNGSGAAPSNGHGGELEVQILYSFPAADRFGSAYFEPENVARRHLDQIEVCFVGLDAAGNVEACTLIQGLPLQPATLLVFLTAARFDTREGFEERTGIHLARLFGLLQVTTLSPKIRFQYTTTGEPPAYRHPSFDRVIAELGFRRGFLLPDELGPGSGLIAYDRTLF